MTLPPRSVLLPLAAVIAGVAGATNGQAVDDSGIARIEGDAEFGAYLAGECETCHAPSTGNAAIPPLHGRAPEGFVLAMQDYRSGVRQHAVMTMIAARLTDEEIAALAAYFALQEE